jgi:hypothetical protein
MASNDYHFVTVWRVRGTCQEVADILHNPIDLPRWWGRVYLEVKQVAAGDDRGVGRVVRLITKGWLPYTIRWQFKVVESRYPHGFSIVASGDFEGQGRWTFEQDGEFVQATYDWRLRTEKPLLKYLSFLFKPLFSSNHRWAMAEGQRALQAELGRRAALRSDGQESGDRSA